MIQKKWVFLYILAFLISFNSTTYGNRIIISTNSTLLLISIQTDIISGSPFCPGASVSIPFTISGGDADAGNIFTAQLSDAFGSFATPINIGTLTATSSGLINGIIPVNTPAGTAYRIRVIASNPYTEGTSNSIDLEILNLPSITVNSNDTICVSSDYPVSGIIPQFYNSLSWSASGDGVFSMPTSLATTYTPSINDKTFGSVWIKLTASSSCGNDVDSMKLVLVSPPTAFAGNDTLVCAWEDIALITANANNYDSLEWRVSGEGSLNDTLILNPIYSPDTTDYIIGSVTLSIFAKSKYCGTAFDQIIISFKTPTFTFAGGNDTICIGNNYTLNNSEVSNFDSLSWSTTGTGTFDNNLALHPTYTPSAADTTAGFSNLILTVFAECGPYKDTVRLAIFGSPTLFAGSDSAVCSLDTLTLNSANAHDYNSIHWTSSGFGHFINPNRLNASYIPSPQDASLDSVVFVATLYSICSDSIVDTVKFKFFNFPNAGLEDTVKACRGQEMILTAVSGGTYHWNNGFNFASMAILPSQTKQYKVTVTNACGSSVDSVIVFVLPTPVLEVCSDTTIDFMFPAQLWATGGTSYEWTPTDGLDNPFIENPTANPKQTTVYYVTAWDSIHLCAVIDSVIVHVYVREYDIYLPSAFSPNKNGGDGNNDVFRALPLGLFGMTNFKMEIYNRWGQLIFESTDPRKGWNGINTEKNLPYDIDGYLYKVTATDPYGKVFLKTGSVVLIK
ncbi:MAG: gliding motility-associated C-terminal domain-containing protein [Bacteroidota bacterium]